MSVFFVEQQVTKGWVIVSKAYGSKEQAIRYMNRTTQQGVLQRVKEYRRIE